ncbi:Sporulation-specific N-acetylmuramoyl-L-alanine amidase [Urinicoccus massiliensis]|uniref:Sporulation-specific N-acetylmuramoyl-L-alanine amidase n=1 Tax=Urinicoccus massiliensis TaxID=1723382 RepID=A0A8H2MEX3_9FIRM|nr:N-acetylmuramoyl-L-alanine amidase [Urinicoccus massiliensis]VFB16400.1 Sporulation-specific N-acetylmuramoyl-L-alanine amidase [Urinicoccus massiliensis]
MKKIVGLLLCFILFSQNIYANPTFVLIQNKKTSVDPVKVEVNGNTLQSAFQPFAYGNRTLVPIREITESMGANVAWNNQNKTAQISLGDNKVVLQINSRAVYINGKKKLIDKSSIPVFATYPKENETKTMVPLRFLSEALSFNVDWNQEKQQASISNVKTVSVINTKDVSEDGGKKTADKAVDLTKKPDDKNTDQGEKREIAKKVKATGPVTVVIDAGHGGKDSGAISPIDPSVKEKDLTLKVTGILKDLLRAKNYEVIETRTRDEYIGLAQRAEIANSNQAEIFVSIHFNSSTSGIASGIEVLYAPEDRVKIKKHEQIHLAKALNDELKKATGSSMRTMKKRPDLAVLRLTEMPAALCELGFVSSPTDLENITQDSYIEKLAQGVANGIERYVNNYVEFE